MTSITYQQEFLAKIRRETEQLIQSHWQEIALHQDKIRLNPDWEAYADLEERGIFKLFTARDAGTLIGYFGAFCRPHIHYRDHVFAYNDVLFLKTEYRSGGVGAGLLRFAEACLRDDGVSVMIVNTKCHKPFDSLLLHLGYDHVENIYAKPLR